MTDADLAPAYFPLTEGEARSMNIVFSTDKWKPATAYAWPRDERRRIEQKLVDLDRATQWPGTKLFNHEAAYHAEILRRIVGRIE